MKYASEDLVNEHEGIQFGMTILERMADLVGNSEKVDVGDVREMVGFLRSFADKCHHGKEEGLLFPAMEKAGVASENGPIGRMLLEHNEGRGYIAQMDASAADKILKENEFVKAAKSYVGLMRAHINKENSILFPLGDKIIPMDEQKRLIGEFEKFEENVMGKGTHEKLHELLHNLKVKYLES